MGRTYWQCPPSELIGLIIVGCESTPDGDVFLLSDGTCLACVPVRNPDASSPRKVLVAYERSRPNKLPEGDGA